MANDWDRFRLYARGLSGNLLRGLRRATLYLEARVIEEAPVVTGNLRNSISSYVIDAGSRSYGVVTVGSKYAGFVIRGTGIYGPRKQRIYPTTKKALAFSYGGVKIVVRSIKGMRPNPFTRRAWRKSKDKLRRMILGEI